MYKLSGKITYVTVDEQLVITNTEENKVVVLENTGKDIMEYIINKTPINLIINTLVEKYGQENANNIQQDIEEFINDLISLNILFDDYVDNTELA
jgi:hypothetical protein